MKSKLIKQILYLVSFLTVIFLSFSLEKTYDIKGDEPILLSNQNGDDLQGVVTKAILSAKKSIYIQIFSIKDKSVINALKKKSDEGINIKIIYNASNELDKELKSKVESYPVKLKGLMHRKILIIDQSQILLGSANFTKSSLKMHDNILLKIISEEIARSIIDFKHLDNPTKTRSFTIGNQLLQLWLTPQDKEAENKLISLIDKAKKSIKVAMFTFTNPKIAAALINAKARGINVDIVIEKTSFDADKILKKFLSKGIFARLSKKQVLLHHKFAFIDEEILVLGSANWTRSAFNINEDDFIILFDMTSKQIQFMKELWKKIDAEAA